MATMLKLTSHDGEEFEVEKEVACMSATVKNMLEAEEDSDAAIPLPNVGPKILAKTLEYCRYHHGAANLSEEEKNAWDEEFVKVEQSTLFELILAANYLDIKSLLDLTCKTVANMIKGRQPEEIRKLFNIPNDFTPEEEEEVRRENAWCEEH